MKNLADILVIVLAAIIFTFVAGFAVYTIAYCWWFAMFGDTNLPLQICYGFLSVIMALYFGDWIKNKFIIKDK